MRVTLINPRREIDVKGPTTVSALLKRLELNREAHLVVVDGTLVTADTTLEGDAQVEIRPVISGGA